MPYALISKIIEDLRDIPHTLPFQLSPFKVNEPFLDTRLYSILTQINERLPNASLTLTTNATPITSITATGIVAHCCMDGAAKYPIGDVSRQHVLELYNAPAYRRLREHTARRQDAEPCNRCSFF